VATDPVWTSRAETDLLELYARLEDADEGRGERLLHEIESCLRLLCLMPEMAPIYEAPFRRMLLRERRHGLYYTPEDRGVVVHAICDLTQDHETTLRHLGIRR